MRNVFFVFCIWSHVSERQQGRGAKQIIIIHRNMGKKSAPLSPEKPVFLCVCVCKYSLSSVSKFDGLWCQAGTDHC